MSVKISLWGLVVFSTLVTKSSSFEFIASVESEDEKVYGRVNFKEEGAKIKITGRISGLKEGMHGLHVHKIGDISEACTKIGEHYNPYNKTHGGLKPPLRHAGDLGNIKVTRRAARISLTVSNKLLSLREPYSILGRSVAVHEQADDLGQGGLPDSVIDGHSGQILACGVIGVLSPLDSLRSESPPVSKISLKTLLLTLFPIIRLNY